MLLAQVRISGVACCCADGEAEELSNLRRLLCIPTDTYREIELATKGRIFQVQQTFQYPALRTGKCVVRLACHGHGHATC